MRRNSPSATAPCAKTWWPSAVANCALCANANVVLTQQADYQTARKYWNKLNERMQELAAAWPQLEPQPGRLLVSGEFFLPPQTGKLSRL